MELNDWLTIIGAFGGLEAVRWGVTFWVNRKTNARKEDASADSMEDENERKQVDWLEERIAQRDAKIDALYVCLLYTSPSPRDRSVSRMPSSA